MLATVTRHALMAVALRDARSGGRFCTRCEKKAPRQQRLGDRAEAPQPLTLTVSSVSVGALDNTNRGALRDQER